MQIVNIILELAIIALLITLILRKNRKIETVAPAVLMSEGKIDTDALEKSGVSLEKLREEARLAGYFNLGDIDTAILEKSGKISFLTKPMSRALNPKDFNFTPVHEGVPVTIVKNGKIIEESFEKAELDREEIMTLILSRGRNLEGILLATITDSGRVDIFEK